MMAKIILPMCLVLTMCLTNASATIYDYTVYGEFEMDNVTQIVTGNMRITDELAESTDSLMLFNITDFSLTVTALGGSSFDFSGGFGLLRFYPRHIIIDPQTGEEYCEQHWFINGENGSWGRYSGPSIHFFTSDMIPYSPISSEYYGVLAPIIALDRPLSVSQYTPSAAIDTETGSQIWLMSTSAPVPEPATLLLLGAGLTGLAAVGRRRK